MDYISELDLPSPDSQNPYTERYTEMGLNRSRALKEVFAQVRSGKITPENEDQIIALWAEHAMEQQRLIDESLFDSLLREQGFYTRRHFYGHLDETIKQINNNPASREKGGTFRGGALLMIDLDNFKLANDTLSHEGGDKVLKYVAGIIKKHVRRKQDLLGLSKTQQQTDLRPETEGGRTGRPGGEELAALLYDIDEEGAVILANTIREELEVNPLTINGRAWTQTISIGVCFLKPDITVEEAIKRSDIALYNSKGNGRNRVTVWKPGMTMPQPQL